MKICRIVLFILLLLLMMQVSLFAEKSKVAVLDATIHSGVKESIVIPITENIIEALVGCGKYTVLDRAHVTKVLEEKKFQVSGIVKSSDIKLVGNYLGADIIVVIDISLIEDIYFVSAKMIDVESGEIKNQASAKDRGDISVIFDIAETVGKKLAGESVASNIAVEGFLNKIDFEFTADKEIIFKLYDMSVNGMKGNKIHTEFQISQNSTAMPKSNTKSNPETVLYDAATWAGNFYNYKYTVNSIRAFGDPTQPYWGSFYIIDTAKDTIIFTKDIQFSLPAKSTTTTNKTGSNYVEPPVKPKSKYTSRIAFSYMYPLFISMDYGIIAGNYLDAHLLQVLNPNLYASLLLSINTLSEDFMYYDILGINLQAGGGMLYPITRSLQGYIGARLGFYFVDAYTAFSLTGETGIDWILKSLTINLRMQYESAVLDTGEYIDTVGASLGIGFVY